VEAGLPSYSSSTSIRVFFLSFPFPVPLHICPAFHFRTVFLTPLGFLPLHTHFNLRFATTIYSSSFTQTNTSLRKHILNWTALKPLRTAKEAAKPNRQRIASLVNQQSLLSSHNMDGMEKEIHVQEEEKAQEERIEKVLLAS